jgi:pyrroline-5-carboxylate reductase
VAAIHAEGPDARALARTLFLPLAEIVDLDTEDLMDAATAVAGSGPAYLHAFTLALARAAQDAGLPPETALKLARGAARSAAASAQGEATLEALIAQVASPGGTTEAGLKALNTGGQLDRAVGDAVGAALNRARDLSA